MPRPRAAYAAPRQDLTNAAAGRFAAQHLGGAFDFDSGPTQRRPVSDVINT